MGGGGCGGKIKVGVGEFVRVEERESGRER